MFTSTILLQFEISSQLCNKLVKLLTAILEKYVSVKHEVINKNTQTAL